MRAYNKKNKPKHESKVNIDNCKFVDIFGKKRFSYNEHFYRNSKKISVLKNLKISNKYENRLFKIK